MTVCMVHMYDNDNHSGETRIQSFMDVMDETSYMCSDNDNGNDNVNDNDNDNDDIYVRVRHGCRA